MKKILVKAVLALFTAVMIMSCANPAAEPTSNNNNNGNNDNKGTLDDPYLSRKLEYYNKLLGVWEERIDPDGTAAIINDYYKGTDARDKGIPAKLHIEPQRWWWSMEGERDYTVKTWDEPFYKYILVNEELNATGFNYKDAGFSEITWSYYLQENTKNKDLNYLDVGKLTEKNQKYSAYLLNFKSLSEGIIRSSNGIVMLVRSKNQDSGSGTGGNGGSGSGNGGQNIELKGSWNYAVAGQTNAGGTITFDNGNLDFKHKVGSQTTSATYTVNGKNISIKYSSYDPETFEVTENSDGSMNLEYKGSEDTSFVLLVFFQNTSGTKKITLTK